MKQVIAIALLGTLSHLTPVYAQEATSFQTWTSKHGTTQSVVKQHKPARHKPSQHRPEIGRYTRPVSLHQAGNRLERLEKKRAIIKRDLRRAKRYHASRSEIRALSQRLHRVSQKLRIAKRDYQHFLKLKLGSRQYRVLLKQTAWLSGNRRPQRAQQVGHNRPYRWRD
jgi:hypothetical protein